MDLALTYWAMNALIGAALLICLYVWLRPHELDALVDELLSFARLQSSQQPPERLSLELAAFLDSVLVDFAEEQERRGVEMYLDVAQAPARVELTPRLTARALQNLLGNALRYCQREVWVAVRRAGKALLIAVEDDGEGISAAEHEWVCEPFYRLDRNRDCATGGFGLELAISRRAVENQGGRLDLSAGAQGGALFELRLLLSPRLGLA